MEKIREQFKPKSFKDQFLEFIKEKFPEFYKIKQDEYEREKIDISNREHALELKIKDVGVLEVLKEYGVDYSKIEQLENGIFKILVTDHFSKDRLPDGYAYKGGAARSLLLRSLGIDEGSYPRDLDIIRLEEDVPKKNDEKVAKEFMPYDYIQGHGVEFIRDVDNYFKTRDITQNELYATDDEIFSTKKCLFDTVRGIIRLSEYESGRFYGETGYKMLTKIIRIYVDAIERYGSVKIKNVPELKDDYFFEVRFLPPFYLALNLDKAYEISPSVAKKYVEKLKELGQLPNYIETVEQAGTYLQKLLSADGGKDKTFYFRHAPIEQKEMEDDWFNFYEEYENLPKHRGHGKSRGNK